MSSKALSTTRLKSLRIDLCTYGPNEGKYEARISFSNKDGDITLNMEPEISRSFMALAGRLLLAHTRQSYREFEKTLCESFGEASDDPSFNDMLASDMLALGAQDFTETRED